MPKSALSVAELVVVNAQLSFQLRLVASLSKKYELSDQQTAVLVSVAEVLVDQRSSLSPCILIDGTRAEQRAFLCRSTVGTKQ